MEKRQSQFLNCKWSQVKQTFRSTVVMIMCKTIHSELIKNVQIKKQINVDKFTCDKLHTVWVTKTIFGLIYTQTNNYQQKATSSIKKPAQYKTLCTTALRHLAFKNYMFSVLHNYSVTQTGMKLF